MDQQTCSGCGHWFTPDNAMSLRIEWHYDGLFTYEDYCSRCSREFSKTKSRLIRKEMKANHG